MAKKRKTLNRAELDSVYLLKMVMYLVIGSFWVRITRGQNMEIPIPIGFIAGIFLASRDRLQIDRKLEYAILLMAMFLGFWLPIGIVVQI